MPALNIDERRLARGFASLLAFAAALASLSASAVEPVVIDDPAKMERYERLVAELRCLVCQNQSLAESNAPLARDMRGIIADQLEEGASDEQITSFMTERYGDFVLLRPRFSAANAALWLGPFAALAVCLLLLPRLLRRRGEAARLSVDERRRAGELLGSKGR